MSEVYRTAEEHEERANAILSDVVQGKVPDQDIPALIEAARIHAYMHRTLTYKPDPIPLLADESEDDRP
jgi:hypothetical protein